MSLEQVVLLPHPPIVVPEVAGDRFNEVSTTANGMIAIADDIKAVNPDSIIIITPHSNIHPTAFAAYIEPEITGSFAMFGAPQVSIRVKNNLDLLQTIVKVSAETGSNDIVEMKPGTRLDHGSGVPLYYILKAGYAGSVVIFNYSYGSITKHQYFGKLIADVAKQSKEKIILLASGDLSHRVIKGAPAGYHPDGQVFDKLIVDAIKAGEYSKITNVNPTLRENAGECAYNSLMVAFGALDNNKKKNKVYSYEAPFGVGYLVASL